MFDSGKSFYNSASRQMCWRLGPGMVLRSPLAA
jgi:hypothetical protein